MRNWRSAFKIRYTLNVYFYFCRLSKFADTSYNYVERFDL